VERDFNTQVVSIVSLANLVEYLTDKPEMAEHLANIQQYRVDYGI
jgi:orotate phosphoribosyltransferase